MFLKEWTGGPYSTNSYVIADANRVGAIIDPTFDSARPIEAIIEANGIKIVAIYLTHSHLDHIADLAKLKKRFNCPVFVHKLDRPNVVDPGSDGLPLPCKIEGVEPEGEFEEGKMYECGSLSFKILHTPGHSRGSVCLYFKEEKALISGDTLFRGTIGRIDLPGSDSDAMFLSLKKLENLPEDVRVYPGHGSATTIREEKKWLSKASIIFGE